MTTRRRDKRIVRRLEVEFSAGGVTHRGITSNLSRRGMFVRTNHALSPGSAISLLIYLPDGKTSSVRGLVRRAQRNPSISLKNGMAVEINGEDGDYGKFIAALDNSRSEAAAGVKVAGPGTGANKTTFSETTIVACPQCGVRNKVPTSRLTMGPRCGKCGSALGPATCPGHKAEASQSGYSFWQMRDRRAAPATSAGDQGFKVGDMIAGRYHILDVFGGEGRSSMGIVYMCHDDSYNQVIALKTLQNRYLESKRITDSFKREALAWIQLGKHPHIVKAHWVRRLDDRMFIACEFIDPDAAGRNSLTSFLDSPFRLNRVLKWAIQFCYGMEYAHTRGVAVHRDIKPDNIMVTGEGDIKITDFGLVGLWDTIDQPDEITSLVRTNRTGLTYLSAFNNRIVAGSPPWMAPEQFYGVAKVNSDVYSFGVVLYQLINNGVHPFSPQRGDTWAVAHKTYPVPEVPENGKPLANIIRKCLEKRRDKRYSHFAEMREDLERVFRKEVTRKTGEHPPAPPVIEEVRDAELINKGMSLTNLGLLEEGIRQYREGLKMNPGSASAHYNLANALAEKALLGEAIAQYRQAVKLDPDMTAAYFNLGMTLFRMNRVDEAITAYNEALRTDPGLSEAYVNLGVAYSKKGMSSQAVESYKEAVRVRPDFAEAHYKLGLTFFAKDSLEEAIRSLQEAVRINPGFAEAYNNLGSALLKKGLIDEAIAAYGKAVALKPDYADPCYNIGLAFLKKNLYAEALNALQEFVEHSPQHDSRLEKSRQVIAGLQLKLRTSDHIR